MKTSKKQKPIEKPYLSLEEFSKAYRETLEWLTRPPYMRTKASIYAYLLEVGNYIDEGNFNSLFSILEKTGEIQVAFMQCGTESSKQYVITDEGKKALNFVTLEANNNIKLLKGPTTK